MNADTTTCQTCGTPISAEVLGGKCPVCLRKVALAEPTLLDDTMMVPPPVATPPRVDWEPPSAEEMSALLPAGAYTVEGFIGRGGMGAVYKGTQLRLKRAVAIKLMRQDQTTDFRERFLREAHTLARLNHPGIVNVIDCGEAGSDLLYIIMEFVDGADLMDVLRSGRMTQETALQLVPQICDALQFAHDHGIVHRDIKPSNILLTRDGRIKIADFGLAKALDPGSTLQTRSGTSMGTPDYAAPEQFVPGAAVDHRADIYALGVMIYQMITGHIPRGAWKPPSQTGTVDPKWDEIVNHAMQPRPEDRYASVSVVRTEVSKISTVTVAPGGADQKPRKNSRTLVFSAAAILVLAVGGYFGWEKFKTPANSSAPAASATPEKPALPAPIRLWDAADKIPKGPEKTWEDDALRLDNVEVAHVFPVVQRVAVKTSIRVNPDTAQGKLGLRQRARDEGAYFLYVDFASSNLALLIEGQDKKGPLKTWKMPRQYRPGEWLPVELRVADGEISVSLEGKLLGAFQDSTFSDFTAFTLSSAPYAHFRDIEVLPLDPSWTNRPPAPSVPVTVTVAETAQRPVPKPASWVDATAQVRDAVVQAGAGAFKGDWLVLSQPYFTRMPDRKILRNAVVRMSFKGVAGMALRSSLTDLSYQCVLNTDRTLGLFMNDSFSNTRVHFNKVVKLEPDFDLLAEHELVMAAEEDLISVWLDGRLMLSQRDSNLAQGRISVIFQAAGSNASLHPQVKKVEYAELGGATSPPAARPVK